MSDIQSDTKTAGDNATPKKIKHRQWGTATLGLLVGILGLIAGRLGHLYPHFDVFSQFGAQFVAVVIAFSFAMLFTRFKATIGSAVTVALLVLYGSWPHMVSTPLKSGPFVLQSGEKPLRVAHFNTFKDNFDYNAIAQEILRLDADVMTLIEMNPKKKQAVLPLIQSKYPHVFLCQEVQYCDFAIISKYPLAAGDAQGVWVGAPYIYAKLGGEMAGVTVFGVHTTRFPYSRAQLTQTRELVRKLEVIPGDLVIMGDFNATPFSRVTSTLAQGANVTRLTELPTWPSYLQLPQLAIDHIFASENFRVIGNQQIGESAGSDHYPIVLTLARKATP